MYGTAAHTNQATYNKNVIFVKKVEHTWASLCQKIHESTISEISFRAMQSVLQKACRRRLPFSNTGKALLGKQFQKKGTVCKAEAVSLGDELNLLEPMPPGETIGTVVQQTQSQ